MICMPLFDLYEPFLDQAIIGKKYDISFLKYSEKVIDIGV